MSSKRHCNYDEAASIAYAVVIAFILNYMIKFGGCGLARKAGGQTGAYIFIKIDVLNLLKITV